jgi:hypothetical protein
MKNNNFKKIIFSVFVLGFLFCFGVAKADNIDISDTGCLTWHDTTNLYLCNLNDVAEIPPVYNSYDIILYVGSYPNHTQVISVNGGVIYGGDIIIYELADPELNNGDYNITITFGGTDTILYADFIRNVPELNFLTSGGLFFYRGMDQNQKINTANDLVAMAGSATQASFGSLGGVLAVLGAIILAFVVIRYIISLIYETDNKKKNRRRI